jgi:hypothetical protein
VTLVSADPRIGIQMIDHTGVGAVCAVARSHSCR